MPLIICNELGIDENTLRRTLIEDEKENFYVFEIKSFVNEPLFEYQLMIKKWMIKEKSHRRIFLGIIQESRMQKKHFMMSKCLTNHTL